jgi:hypothetical protein
MKSYVEPNLPALQSCCRRKEEALSEGEPSKRYLEEVEQIGTIFDQNLFEKINQVEHIR